MTIQRDANGMLYDDQSACLEDPEGDMFARAEEFDSEALIPAANDDNDHIVTDDLELVVAEPLLKLGERRDLDDTTMACANDAGWSAKVLSREGGLFGRVFVFTPWEAFDAVWRPIVASYDDPRWHCGYWLEMMREFVSDAILPSLSATTGIAGQPTIILPPNPDTAGHLGWGVKNGGVMLTLNHIGGACLKCTGCKSKRPNQEQSAASWVYFIQAKDGGAVKIGRSVNPQERLSGLQTAHPTELRILTKIPGGNTVERSFHALFAADRIRPDGEWFRPSTQLMAFVRELKGAA